MIVPRHRHSAVARNRLKRQLREILRTEIMPGLDSLDVVVRVSAGAYEAPRSELRADLMRLVPELVAKTC